MFRVFFYFLESMYDIYVILWINKIQLNSEYKQQDRFLLLVIYNLSGSTRILF